MNILILDGYTLNPGDLTWAPFEALGQVSNYDRISAAQTVELGRDAEVIITNKSSITADMMAQLPRLRYIGVTATGYDMVAVDAARERGIVVTNVRNYGSRAVAQHVFALLLNFTNRVQEHSQSVRAGGWVACPDFSYTLSPIPELAGKTLGLVGYGGIARSVADIGRVFGMNILAHRRHPEPETGVDFVDLETLFRESDFLSLHCPLTPETRGLVKARTLALMKPTALLINTGRGPLIVEEELANALQNGQLAGAALDVLSAEPPKADNPLLSAPNCVITPHNAWAAVEARRRLMDGAAENLKAFLAGKPTNVVQ
ncbi:MAG: D-2-hydroxyacid dehydrogenase [Cytophagaceae bacterium]|nr:D-2-hydroxyacid dehydrogenase [Cytophagaceae bacterium]